MLAWRPLQHLLCILHFTRTCSPKVTLPSRVTLAYLGTRSNISKIPFFSGLLEPASGREPVHSLPPVIPALLSPLCLSSLASWTPEPHTFPPKRLTCFLRPNAFPVPSCYICPLIFLSTGLLPALTNCAHPAALPDSPSPLVT